jgi:MFS family permease
MVGYASVCYVIGNILGALLSGHVIRWIPRPCQLVAAMVTNIAVGITWLLWQPTARDVGWMLAISVIQGLTLGVYKTQLIGMCVRKGNYHK